MKRVIGALFAITAALYAGLFAYAQNQQQQPGQGPNAGLVAVPPSIAPFLYNPLTGQLVFQLPVSLPASSTLPAPTASTLGGVFSSTCATHKFQSNVDTIGNENCTQPVASDVQNSIAPPSGRITLTSGTPVLSSTVTAAGTVLFTPFMGSNVPIFDGTNWNTFQFSELSNILANSTVGNAGPAAGAASSCYDLFLWNAGTNAAPSLFLTRGPAWTTCVAPGARAAGGALSYQNGIQLNTSAITNGPGALRGTWVGTIATDGSGATVTFNPGGAVTAAVIGIWNYYNRITGRFGIGDTGASYTYTSSTIREARAGTAMQVTEVQGALEDAILADADSKEQVLGVNGAFAGKCIGLGSTSACGCQGSITYSATTNVMTGNRSIVCSSPPKLGQGVVSLNEFGDNVNANTFDLSSSDQLEVYLRY